MTKWQLVAEVKDSGYYIGWCLAHKCIHIPEPIIPMSKTSLVQIGGMDGCYQVRGITYAHSVFEPHKAGLKLFDETHYCKTLEDATVKATQLKSQIAKRFNDVTRSTNKGVLIERG